MTATSANRSVNLPTTGIKAGYEAEVVTACTSPYTITVKSSDGDTVDTMKGTKGRIRCVALQDTPTDGTHWEVVQVEDAGAWTPTISSLSAGSSSSPSGKFIRNARSVFIKAQFTLTGASGTQGTWNVSGLPYPPTDVASLGAVYINAAILDVVPLLTSGTGVIYPVSISTVTNTMVITGTYIF